MAWDDTQSTGNDITAVEWNNMVTATKSIASITDMDEQSFTNLLENGDFESWSAGAAAAMDGWVYSQGGSGGGVAQIADTKIKTYIARMTKSSSGYSNLKQTFTGYAQYAGLTLTLGCWVKSANSVTGEVIIRLNDGVSSSSTIYQNSGNWEWLTVTKTMSEAISTLCVSGMVDSPADSTVDFVGMILVIGSICPAFSPKPAPATNPTFIGNVSKSATNGITAFATGGQASAVELTTDINEVSVCATGGDSVKLPNGVAGMEIMVVNHGAAAMDLFPASGDYINEAAVNTAVSIAINATAICYCYVADYWGVVEVTRA